MMKNFIEIRGLTVIRGGFRVLDGLDLDIGAGVTGLLGPSGCGKSTLMRAVVGVQQSSRRRGDGAGRAGRQPGSCGTGSATSPRRRASTTTSPCVENLRYFARVLGVDRRRCRPGGRAVDLARHADQMVGQLSGGQRSRASLAVALLGRPGAAGPRRAHGRARPGAAPGPVGAVPPAGRRRRRRAGLQPRDGRGRALRPAAADARGRDPRRRHPGRASCERTGAADVESAFLSLVEAATSTASRPRITLGASPARVLTQLRHDHRTLALLLVVPCAAAGAAVVDATPTASGPFDRFGPALLALFPFIVMFLVTSVTTLRERSSGTLERLLAMPMGKLDFLLGYAARVRRRWPPSRRLLAVGVSRRAARPRRRGPGVGCSSWSPWWTPCSAPRWGCSSRAFAPHRVPGRAVHAGPGHPADAAVRSVRRRATQLPARARRGQRRAAAVLRRRRDDPGAEPRGTARAAACGPTWWWSPRFAVAALGLGAATLRRRTP